MRKLNSRVGDTRETHASKLLRVEKDFFRQHLDELLTDFEDRYVAIVGSEVVDNDASFSALAERVFQRSGVRPIYMPKVGRSAVPVDLTRPRLTV